MEHKTQAAVVFDRRFDGAVKAEANKPTDKLACQIAFAARFDLEALEPVTLRYFYDADDGTDPFDDNATIVPVPAELIKHIGFFLVPASRTWDRMISFGSELFRRVVSYVGGRPAVAVLAERDGGASLLRGRRRVGGGGRSCAGGGGVQRDRT